MAWALLAACPALPASAEDRYAERCRPEPQTRFYNPQGTALWGARQDWDPAATPDERRSVLVSAELQRPVIGKPDLSLRDGRLEAGGAPLSGAVLRGTSSAGGPVEVAVCGEERDASGLTWYRIQAWNPVAGAWQNPCTRAAGVSEPRALAVAGVWDPSGAHADRPGQFTFACQSGAIAKCAGWGYQPWASKGGQPLASLHQACTRMARADYCGDGESHTRDGTPIDLYDARGVLARTTRATALWQPDRASFEAAWGPDGAVCVARARDGRPLSALQRECPGRFDQEAGLELDGGDRCVLSRPGAGAKDAVMRNRSYPVQPEGG